jgi:hypothetical protein
MAYQKKRKNFGWMIKSKYWIPLQIMLNSVIDGLRDSYKLSYYPLPPPPLLPLPLFPLPLLPPPPLLPQLSPLLPPPLPLLPPSRTMTWEVKVNPPPLSRSFVQNMIKEVKKVKKVEKVEKVNNNDLKNSNEQKRNFIKIEKKKIEEN